VRTATLLVTLDDMWAAIAGVDENMRVDATTAKEGKKI